MTTITEEATEGVRVKPLSWTKARNSDSLVRADTILGTYHVWTHAEANGRWFWNLSGVTEGENGDELAVRAAAQADYEARIRSALVAPQAEGRDTGLRKALKTLLDCGNAVVGADPSDPDAAEAFDMWNDARLAARRALSNPDRENK